MVDSKYFNTFVVALMVVAVIACFGGIIYAHQKDINGKGITQEYESKLFDTEEIMDISIDMNADDWEDMLANAIDEEYYSCDVTVNGTTFKEVGIRTKGNTSLSNLVNDPDTKRYSLKLEFDHYIEDQTCFGLDKLVLNNNYADATNMKEALVYDMFQFLGADVSLYNYAKITVNNEYFGVYLALESVEDSFLVRNYGAGAGNLYKPESMGVGGAGKADANGGMPATNGQQPEMNGQMPEMNGERPEMPQGDAGETGGMPATNGQQSEMNGQMPEMNGERPEMPQGDAGETGGMPATNGQQSEMNGQMPEMNGERPEMPQGDAMENDEIGGKSQGEFGGMLKDDMGKGKESGQSSGADLNYVDDDLDSYQTIWDGEVKDTSDKDHKRVVKALKNISEGDSLEDYMDVDNVLRYMAVQTFVVNLDSLTGNMAHNYYLYEEDGSLNIIPWDYNLAFGGFQGGNASDTVNFPIDTPFSSDISLEDREFFAALLQNDEYLEQYHEYLRMLCEEYIDSGRFEEHYNSIRNNIDELVKTDPNALYTYEEYQDAIEILKKVIYLRCESIEGQLDGIIPSTWEGQKTDAANLINVDGIDLKSMGQMNNSR